MLSATEAGLVLLAQRARYRFIWRSSHGSGIVTSPALVKVTDDDARSLDKGMVMIREVVQR